MQQTLVLLKPDCVQRRLVGEVIGRFEAKGLRVAGMKMIVPERSLAEKHYEVHKERPFYGELLDFLTSGPVVALVLEGREAVAAVRKLMGATDGAKAEPGTVRGDFALSIQNNLVHGSDSPDNAEAEIKLWFGEGDLLAWESADKRWVG